MIPPVIIQAGGKGTRLRPYTAVLPKPLMPVADMPILEIVVRQLVYYGFDNIHITTSHLAHLIELFFGDGSNWQANIRYVREDKPLGTIGPIKKIRRPDVPFLVMNGDLLTDLDYRALYNYHQQHDAWLTVAVYKGHVPVSLGVLDYDEEGVVTGFREKPDLYFWASMGVYVFSPELWDLVPEDVNYGFDTLMADMLRRNLPVKVFPWDRLWLDIGRPEDYEKANEEFLRYKHTFLPGGSVKND